MITTVTQRWRERRGTYRPAGEVIVPAHYEVAPIPDDRTARAFVEQHHYAGTYPAARYRFGLYWGGLLVGVAVFSHPMNDRVLAVFPGETIESVELGRLVLLDRVPGNGESFFVARCFEHLRREGLVGVVSFSDPVRRLCSAGRPVFRGHIGNVYQALNGIHDGRSTARTLLLLADGTVFSGRAAQKIRAGERGHEYAAMQLVRAGRAAGLRLAAPAPADDPRAWLARWLPLLTRPLRHPGNLRYVWGLDRAAKRHLARTVRALPYPKFDARRAA